MHEVEVKAALENKDAFIEALSALGCALSPEITQDDTLYVRTVGSLELFLSNTDYLRLRVEDGGRTLFTFKHHPGRITTLDSAPLELELEVSSKDTMEHMLTLMGYKEAVRIHKRRRKGIYEKWEVCVDEVAGLGAFVELEEMVPEGTDIAPIQARMETFLKGLGVPDATKIRDRYDVLLLKKEAGL